MAEARRREAPAAGGPNVLPGAVALRSKRPLLSMTAQRLLVVDNHDVGVYAGGGSELTLHDARVASTSACDGAACATGVGGHGLGAYTAARLSVERFVVDQADTCGVHLASGGGVDLTDGEVRNCVIGACVQVDGFAVERLSNSVRYHDNGVNLEATSLPVPSPASPVGDSS